MTLKNFIKLHPKDKLVIYLNGKLFRYINVDDISEKIIVDEYELTLNGEYCVLCKKKGLFS